MKKNRSLFSILAVALLAISLPISIYILKTGNLDFRISAFESDEPVQVQITDIGGSSFRVSWSTEKPVYGAIRLVDNIEPVTESTSTSYHSLVVKNLQLNRSYKFQLLSDGKLFPNEYSVQTAGVETTNPNLWITGQVFSKDGVNTQKGGLLVVQLTQNSVKSQKVSTVINETGGFKLNLGNLLNEANSAAFPTKAVNDVILEVYTDGGSVPVTKQFTMDLTREGQIPNIYLGDINLDLIPAN